MNKICELCKKEIISPNRPELRRFVCRCINQKGSE